MGLPKRKPNRLPGYDYGSPGAYFVTVCTRGRRGILSRISVGEGACSSRFEIDGMRENSGEKHI